jgi:hypothetical protein
MGENREPTGGGELAHGYRAKTVRSVAKTTAMDAQGTETNGYRPSTSEAKPAVRPAPPQAPAGDAGGSK